MAFLTCDCGKKCTAVLSQLRYGKITSCGCMRGKRLGDSVRTHGLSHTPVYHTWLGIKRRCSNPNDENYPYYGGRGIRVHKSWENDFMAFYKEVGDKPEGLSLDRIDTDKNYEPGNVRWADGFVQANNRRNNHMVEFNGEKKSIADWARQYGICRLLLRARIHRGEEISDALTRPVGYRS